MKINLETIQKLNPCQDRLDNYKNNYDTNDFTLEEFLNLDKITYSDKVWVVTKLFTKKQNVLWSIKCAESVLHLFESKYPEDIRPRNAIEVAKAWTVKQDKSAASAAESAWYSAESAWYSAESAWYSRSASESAADYAARSAARSASWAARSATATDSAAKSADSAARSAAWSASWSTESAESAESTDWFAEKQQEELNLKFMLEVYNETKGE